MSADEADLTHRLDRIKELVAELAQMRADSARLVRLLADPTRRETDDTGKIHQGNDLGRRT